MLLVSLRCKTAPYSILITLLIYRFCYFLQYQDNLYCPSGGNFSEAPPAAASTFQYDHCPKAEHNSHTTITVIIVKTLDNTKGQLSAECSEYTHNKTHCGYKLLFRKLMDIGTTSNPSSSELGPGCGGNSLSRHIQTSLSPLPACPGSSRWDSHMY